MADHLAPLDVDILRIACQLAEAGAPCFHGWHMGQQIADLTGRAPGFGALYRALGRLQELGCLESETVAPARPNLPPGRLYRITAHGRAVLTRHAVEQHG